MKPSAEVVVIGGGIVGASVAYHLAAAGSPDVLVLEREAHLGKGSTGKSMGGVRAQFGTEVNIRMSLHSIPFFRAFEEVVGHPSGYKSQGYLFMATSERQMEVLRANVTRQLGLGLKTVELLKREDILRIVPQVRGDDIVGGSFCSTDGFVDPHLVMTGFMTRAIDLGVTLWRGTEVTGVETDVRGVCGVKTTKGDVATRTVVNAAGAWAASVARLAGVDLPVTPLRRMIVPTEPFAELSDGLPMVIDMSTGFHFRPEGRGFLMAWNDAEERPGVKTEFDPAFIEKILIRAVNRVPCFESVEVNPKRCWAGLYEMTPDHHSILGPVPGVPGYYLANGFSGHGVMHSPATGRILADLILGGTTRLIDLATLSYERFAQGRLVEEPAVL